MVYSVGGGCYSTTAPVPGKRYLIHDGVRIVEVELVEWYVGTLWKARVLGTDRTTLVETGL